MILAIYRLILSVFAIGDEISTTVSVILRKKSSGKELNTRQQERINKMRELVRVQRDDHHRGITNSTVHGQISRWKIRRDFKWHQWLDILVFSIAVMDGIITVPSLYYFELWRFFLLQVTTFFFFIWIFVNDSHVEDELFFKLIWISELERPKT